MIKWPEGRVYQISSSIEENVENIRVGYGPRFQGERIRKDDFHVEYGGPKWTGSIFQLLEVVTDPDEVRDGRVELVGPDINEVAEGSSFPFGWIIKMYGKEMREDYDEFFLRQICGDFLEQVEGIMAVNARANQWFRVGKNVGDRITWPELLGLLFGLAKSAFPIVDAIEARVIIGSPEVGGAEFIKEIVDNDIRPKWEAAESRMVGIEDDDVDEFYGCTLCQSFAPNHVCMLAPERVPFCGIINYKSAEVSLEIDPFGYLVRIPKGKKINEAYGQYEGVNEYIFGKSNKTIKRVSLYSTIKYPQTS